MVQTCAGLPIDQLFRGPNTNVPNTRHRPNHCPWDRDNEGSLTTNIGQQMRRSSDNELIGSRFRQNFKGNLKLGNISML